MLARPRRTKAPTLQIRALRAATVAALVTLAGATGANGATFCVKAPSCHGTSEPDLPTAVGQSAKTKPAAGGTNMILLGAGTFGWPHAGTADVKAGDPRVLIKGAGASTVLDGDPSMSFLRPVLALENGSTVSNLQVALGAGERLGLELSSTSSATGIVVNGSQTSPGSVGVDVEGGASLRSSTITMSMTDDPTFTFTGPSAVTVDLSSDGSVPVPAGSGRGSATIAGDTLTGAIGLGVRGGTVHGEQLNIKGSDDGALVTSGSLTLDDALVQVAQPRQTSSAIGVGATQPFGQPGSPRLTVRNSTIVGDNTMYSAAVFGGSSAQVTVDSVAITSVASAIRASDGGTVAISYSNFDPAKIMLNGGTVTRHGRNINVAPGFVGRGNFALKTSSKLIDAGNPSEPNGGAPRVDLIGDRRSFGPHADIGACEYVGSHTPRCPAGPPVSHPKKVAPQLSLSTQAVTLSLPGSVAQSVSCPGNASDACVGTLTLTTVKLLGQNGPKHVAIVAGSAPYSIKSGRGQTVTVQVSSSFVKLLKSSGSLLMLVSSQPSKRSERFDATATGFLLVYKP